jgi:hypothetical protein
MGKDLSFTSIHAQNAILNLEITYDKKTVNLASLCFRKMEKVDSKSQPARISACENIPF